MDAVQGVPATAKEIALVVAVCPVGKDALACAREVVMGRAAEAAVVLATKIIAAHEFPCAAITHPL